MTKSRISLPVIPYNNIFQDIVELYQFLLATQEEFTEKNDYQIVSFSQEIASVDPLAILQAIVAPTYLHFYWENPRLQEAIAGCGTTQSLTIESANRFTQSQKFIEACFQKIIKTGDIHLSGAGPHIFCSFTFFPSLSNLNSPFPSATLFLPLFQVVKKRNSCILVINLTIDSSANISIVVNKIHDYLKKIDWSKYHSVERMQKLYRITQINKETQKKTSYKFRAAVASALNSIQQKELTKIVIAHALDVTSPVPFQLIQSLDNLRTSHPDCYIFSVSNAKGHNFIGASPERLLIIQNQELITDALAGSAPRGKTVLEDANLARQLSESEKERREHQAVIEFIIQRLCQLGLNPQRSPRKLLQLSNIQHLWTPIYAQLADRVHPLEIVAQLHPTPAVAGVPTQLACEQIRRYESFDRALYAAPLGWIDYQGNSEFIVGIRSALIKGDRARLYAGAGIVAGSDPNKEFAEVQLKLQSLLKALV
jgi:menaquinone-specific isochorismate synthase